MVNNECTQVLLRMINWFSGPIFFAEQFSGEFTRDWLELPCVEHDSIGVVVEKSQDRGIEAV